ncbi:MAG: GTPase domain-containing protein [Deltaproteobacteria bacterium]|nr:GTPase domain-containing protein [Deltaproteobacteria bacterium]
MSAPRGCRNRLCTLADGGRCAREAEFTNPAADCPDLIRGESDLPALVEAGGRPAPWGGDRLNAREIEAALWRSPARLFGLLGARGSGKTTLIASFFLRLANGQRDGFAYRFASSRTLRALQDLTDHAASWHGDGDIVPHTPLDAEGQYVHLGLRPESNWDNRHVDVILTDLSGETLATWADAPRSVRNIQFMNRANGILVVVDSAELMSPSGLRYDRDTSYLIERAVELQRSARGLGLVFSKIDKLAEPPIITSKASTDAKDWGELGRRASRCFGALMGARISGLEIAAFGCASFPRPLSDGQPIGVVEPFAFLMRHADSRPRALLVERPIVEPAASWFERMRRVR